MNFITAFEKRFDDWLRSPVPNAAGRMSLYRILFGLYYLWIIRTYYFRDLAYIPDGNWSSDTTPVYLVELINGLANRPSPLFFQLVEVILVASLVLLVVGFRVRIATLLVLISGIFLFAFSNTFGKVSHGNAMYAAYLPAIMLFSSWGSNYSIDALLKWRQGDPHDHSWCYIWPMRAALILLAILFFASGYMKLTGENWTTNPNLIQNLLLRRNISATTAGVVDVFNYVNLWIVQFDWISTLLQYIALLFELSFPLALVNRRLTAFYLSTAILFHVFNGLFLEVGFVQILIFYAIFIDWQQVYETLPLKRLKVSRIYFRIVPSWLIQVGSLTVALLIGLLWSQTLLFRGIFRQLHPDWVWYVVGVIGVVWWIRSTLQVVKGIFLPRLRSEFASNIIEAKGRNNVT